MSSNSEETRVIKKRKRHAVSCSLCRTRKLRCDRAAPACSNCVSRKETCDIESRGSITLKESPASPVHQDAFTSTIQYGDNPESLRAKLERLERIVQNLTVTERNTPPSTETPVSGSSCAESSTTASGNSTFGEGQFASRDGQTLWETLLVGIAEVKAHVHEFSPGLTKAMDHAAPTLLFGSSKNLTQAEVLRLLPSRHTCDKILEAAFTSLDGAIYILHKPSFVQQYDDFWSNQEQTSLAWLALLFGMLRIAIYIWMRDESEPLELQGKCADLAAMYRTATMECLRLTGHARRQDHLMEALLIHLYIEYSSTRDLNPDVWVLMGLINRMGMKMGYHVDPSTIRDLTPFECEMRRRVYTYMQQADILISFQNGMPSMLPEGLIGNLPRNIRDSDFGPESAELPPPLPNSEITKISFIRSKASLAFGLARALRGVDQHTDIPYSRILELDREMRTIYRSIPEKYRIDKLPDRVGEDPALISSRLILANVYHRALCVIHSKHLKAASSKPEFLYSRMVCVDSAMTLLSFQAFRMQPFFLNNKTTNLTRFQTSLTIHDYFLAATMLCTALFTMHDESGITLPSAQPDKDNILAALDKSVVMFNEMRTESEEAGRASDLVQVLLRAYRDPSTIGQKMHRGANPTMEQPPAPPTPGDSLGLPSDMMHPDGGDFSQWGDWDPDIFGFNLDDPLSYMDTLRFDANFQ